MMLMCVNWVMCDLTINNLGLYKDGVFHVDAIGCPPAEPAQVTR